MTATILLQGVIIGFAIAAPVGPVGVICIRRSLAQGGLYGFVSGLGAATADAIYGCIAAFGLAWLTNLLIGYQMWLKLCGGVLLLWMGWRTWSSRPADLNADAEAPRKSMLAAYASVLAITLTNPMTILAFAGIIAGAGITVGQQLAGPALLLVGGVFSGSLLWWLFLSSTASLLRKKLKPGGLLWINRLSGIIIVGYGLWALFTAF